MRICSYPLIMGDGWFEKIFTSYCLHFIIKQKSFLKTRNILFTGMHSWEMFFSSNIIVYIKVNQELQFKIKDVLILNCFIVYAKSKDLYVIIQGFCTAMPYIGTCSSAVICLGTLNCLVEMIWICCLLGDWGNLLQNWPYFS